MFELDQTSIVPLYKQLKDRIKEAILDGSLKPNQKIPSELELSQTYQISRITVRNAISELVDEELLEKKQGKGTFVCTPKIDVRSPNFTIMCTTNHKVPSSKIIKIVKQPASERDIRELNLSPGGEVICCVFCSRTGSRLWWNTTFFQNAFPNYWKRIWRIPLCMRFCGINTAFISMERQSRFRLRNRQSWRRSFWEFLFLPQ